MTIEKFASLIEKQQRKSYRRNTPEANAEELTAKCSTRIHKGYKHTYIFVGENRWLVVLQDGRIFGSWPWTNPDFRRPYGTIDTVDDWYWGEYRPFLKTDLERMKAIC